MDIKNFINPLKGGAIFSVTITALMVIFSLGSYYPKYDYDSMESFSGILTSVKATNKKYVYKLKANFNDEHRTFYLSLKNERCKLDKRISEGKHITVRLYKDLFGFGWAHAAELSISSDIIIPYRNEPKKQISEIIFEIFVVFVGLTVIGILVEHAHIKHRKNP